MSRGLPDYLYLGAIVVLLAVIVVGLIPSEPVAETDAARAHRIAGELRCPFCSGESIAAAPSAVGQDLRDLIAEQVAAGMSDDEIFDYFVGVYAERVLLEPPLLGPGLALWLVPLLVLGGGLYAVGRRRRGAPRRIFTTGAARDEAVTAIAADIADVAVQEAAGEIDTVTAARLRQAYEEERTALGAAVILPDASALQWRGRTFAAAAVLVGGALALTVAVVSTAGERAPGDLISGGSASDSLPTAELSGLSDDDLEAAVAANPDGVALRMVLAGRYFTAGDFAGALAHYVAVLERDGTQPEALANIGWITYQAGEPAAGLDLVLQSLNETDQLPQAFWYLANIRYRGYQDAAGAVEPLQILLEFDLPADFRMAAEELLVEVEAAR